MKKILQKLAKTIFLFIIVAIYIPAPIKAQVVINEIYPNPDTSRDATEWLELYNPTAEPIDIAGWSINNEELVFSSSQMATIAGQDYLVLTRDKAQFRMEYPSVDASKVSHLPVSLTNSGKILALADPEGVQTDSVEYAATSTNQSWQRPGPICVELAKSSAHTLLQQNSNYLPECSYSPEQQVNFKVEFSTNQMDWQEQLKTAPFTNIYVRVVVDEEGAATLIDHSELIITTQDQVFEGDPVSLAELVTEVSIGFIYNGEGYQITTDKLLVVPKIQISEVMIDPGDELEWVEILNDSEGTLELSAVGLQVSGQNVNWKPLYEVSTAIEHLDKGYTAWQLPENSLSNCSQPAACQESIKLLYKQKVVDYLNYDDSLPNLSYSLDQDQLWQKDWLPTPGQVNTPLTEYSQIQIIELAPAPVDGETEWVKLKNTGKTTASLWGWKLSDKTSEMDLSGLTINSESEIKLENVKISLNNSGDEISLTDVFGKEIDKFIYPESVQGEEWIKDAQGQVVSNYQRDTGQEAEDQNNQSAEANGRDPAADESVVMAGVGANANRLDLTSSNAGGTEFKLPNLITVNDHLSNPIDLIGKQSPTLNQVSLLSLDPQLWVRIISLVGLFMYAYFEVHNEIKGLLGKVWRWWSK